MAKENYPLEDCLVFVSSSNTVTINSVIISMTNRQLQEMIFMLQ